MFVKNLIFQKILRGSHFPYKVNYLNLSYSKFNVLFFMLYFVVQRDNKKSEKSNDLHGQFMDKLETFVPSSYI